MAVKSVITSKPVAGVIGVFAGGLTVLLLESGAHWILGTADPSDLGSITMPMFTSVLVAWIVGSGVGSAVATAWSKPSSIGPGAFVGMALLAGAVTNMFAFPHPVWMMVAAVLLMPATAVLAANQLIKRV